MKMKQIIIILLLSSIICQNLNIKQEIKDTIKCLSKSIIFEIGLEKIKEAFNSENLSNIINIVISLFNQLKDDIVQCAKKNLQQLSNEVNDENDNIKLGYPKYVYVLYSQIGKDAFDWFDQGGITYLKEMCHRRHGQQAWFCVYLAQN